MAFSSTYAFNFSIRCAKVKKDIFENKSKFDKFRTVLRPLWVRIMKIATFGFFYFTVASKKILI